jgi:EAL domain-containing protein (putative c-di-GMP-specific phosphodiesterase class I)
LPADAIARPRQGHLESLVDRLGRRYFPEFPLSIGDSGAVIAQFYRSRVTSGFQPITRARSGERVGNHALLRVESGSGESIAPWGLFAQAGDDAALVKLDRLCRSVHALNYFAASARGDGLLFLNVERRLLTGVSADHGAWFEAVLALMGASPTQVVIVMPAEAVDNPVAFVRAAISYRIRGYRVMVPVRSTTEADLSHVFLADPHYVAIDSAAALGARETQRFLEALARRGIHLLARGVERPEQAEAARRAGVELLQGFHVGRP